MAKKPLKGTAQPIQKVEINPATVGQIEELLLTLKERFETNMSRHEGLEWGKILKRLEAQPEKLQSLFAMESTGGEPDVIGYDDQANEYLFCDCSPESPIGRRSICYDGKGQAEREKKGIFPAGNAVDLAAAMGIELLDEEQYRGLKEIGEFDTKTSSWIETPADIRALGGAIFADRRYGRIFVYHNSAPSFYGSRGFRGLLKV